MQALTSAPFAHDRSTVGRLMGQVAVALTPLTLFAFYRFGWPAVYLWMLCCVGAVATEGLMLHWRGLPLKRAWDGSALLTGWLLSLCLPPWAPWWIGVGGAVFAIAIGKHLYGGLGQNPFNPALLARVALLISFPAAMTVWPDPRPWAGLEGPSWSSALEITFGAAAPPEGWTGATALGGVKTELAEGTSVYTAVAAHHSGVAALIGTLPGSMGETSGLLVCLGGLYLLRRRVIQWAIPTCVLVGAAAPAAFAHALAPAQYPGAAFHITAGGLLLGAFFYATDPVTTPKSQCSQVVFGLGCGFTTWLVRTWGGFPEAAAFGILFMNAWTPLLDRWLRPRVYGRNFRGHPLRMQSSASSARIARGGD